MALVHVQWQTWPPLPRVGAARRHLPHTVVAPDGASGGTDLGARGRGVGGPNGAGNGLGCPRRGCLWGAAGAVVFAGLYRPDWGPAAGEAWIRAGNAKARAAEALRPRAPRPDRALHTDLSKSCVGAPGL